MLFNSLQFLVFFPVVTALYFVLPHSIRWLLLLIASCVFYMAFIPAYIFILFLLIGVDYIAGIEIENASGKKRTLFLILSIVSNLSILFFFKYFNFFNESFSFIAHTLHTTWVLPDLAILLPIGLSFHTFQSMSYTIEVYRGKFKAEKNLGIFALYVMFYPQLVAGPIERPYNLIHQFYERHYFEFGRVMDGLKQMLWGFFQKVVVADRAALFADAVYNNPYQYKGLGLLVGTFFFAIQIYGDFAGYSNIAIGAARVMGFDLMKNFNRPYFSQSISEFWKRWHISLSSWFRDYVYISLGGNRVVKWRWYYNLFLTFLLSGLWHGAKWTFVLWGALNGFYLIFSIWTARARKWMAEFTRITRVPLVYKFWQIGVTFSLISFSWIFFRAKSFADLFYILSHVGDGWETLLSRGDTLKNFLKTNTLPPHMHALDLLITLGVISVMFALESIETRYGILERIQTKPVYVRWVLYSAFIWSIVIFGTFANRQFIYFTF